MGVLKLRNATDVTIVRHDKIRGDANPYDLRFEEYFEVRSTLKMEKHLAGRNNKLRYLWRRQSGRCPVCGELITEKTRWHIHHLVRHAEGALTLFQTSGYSIQTAIDNTMPTLI